MSVSGSLCQDSEFSCAHRKAERSKLLVSPSPLSTCAAFFTTKLQAFTIQQTTQKLGGLKPPPFYYLTIVWTRNSERAQPSHFSASPGINSLGIKEGRPKTGALTCLVPTMAGKLSPAGTVLWSTCWWPFKTSRGIKGMNFFFFFVFCLLSFVFLGLY